MLMIYLNLLDDPKEQEHFKEIYARYRNLMFVCAKEILKDDGLAEDAVHDAFLKIAKNIGKIFGQDDNKIKRFVVVVAENSAKDIYRKRKRYMEISWEEIEMTYQFPQVSQLDGMSEMEKLILNLPLSYRQVFTLKYSWGYKSKEIAQIMGMTEGSVRQKIFRGKEMLRKCLEERECKE